MKKALELSQSDLAVLCADDDFLVPSGLEKCIKFALDNPEYSCVHGQYGRFVINEHKIQTIDGSYKKIIGDTFCVHGDSLEIASVIKDLFNQINKHNLENWIIIN